MHQKYDLKNILPIQIVKWLDRPIAKNSFGVWIKVKYLQVLLCIINDSIEHHWYKQDVNFTHE